MFAHRANRANYVCLLFAVMVAAAGLALAEIPRTISYQGLLADKDTGEPLSGTHSLTFSLYTQSSGGASLWSETRDVTTDDSGVFSTLLGSINPIDLVFDVPCWLEIAVGGETLTPRRELASVPYAFRAANADSLDGLTSASYALTGHLHDERYVIQGEAGSITAGMIAGGTGSGLDADLLDGQHAAAFAGAAHQHDDRYYTEAELSAADGAVNQPGDPVDWTKIKGLPEGFADGTDNAGSGDGHSLDAADGNPTDVVNVNNEGDVTINTTSIGARLMVYDEARAAIWAGSGSAVTPAISGDGNDASGVAGYSIKGIGIQGMSYDGAGVHGTSTRGVGVMGACDTTDGVQGVSNKGRGVFGASTEDCGVVGSSVNGYGIFGASQNGFGVMASSNNSLAGYFQGEVRVTGRVDSDSAFSIGTQAVVAVPGTDNLFLGQEAGWDLARGPQRSTCVGQSAGYANLGSDNVFLGYSAGRGSSIGPEGSNSRNVFAGAHAGYMNYGDDNVFIGFDAGRNNSQAFRNTFVGAKAGRETSGGGVNNVFLGAHAGLMNTVGSASVCCGAYAGQYRNTGDGNTYVGYEAGGAGSAQDGTTGSTNVGVGLRAGYGADGDDNVFLGYEAGYGFDGNDRLFIANGRNPEDVLIYGNFTTGHVGLGTTAPERKLHILGNGPRVLVEAMTGNPEVNLKVTGDSWGDIWAMYKHVEDGDLHFFQGSDRVTFESGTGNVAIGATDAAGYRLCVNGSVYASTGYFSSDARLKTDLLGIDDALGKVMRLNGMSFRWRTEDHPDRGFPQGRHYGLVAQEVEEVLPEVVGAGPGDEKALAYSELIPVLVESVKQLKVENDALRARIDALENRGTHY